MAESGNIPLDLASHSCGEASIHTRLEDGRTICIRTVTPKDEERLRREHAEELRRWQAPRPSSGGGGARAGGGGPSTSEEASVTAVGSRADDEGGFSCCASTLPGLWGGASAACTRCVTKLQNYKVTKLQSRQDEPRAGARRGVRRDGSSRRRWGSP